MTNQKCVEAAYPDRRSGKDGFCLGLRLAPVSAAQSAGKEIMAEGEQTKSPTRRCTW